MDSREIRELIELISRSNFSTFELEREGFKLRLVKGGARSGLEMTPLPPENGSTVVSVAPAELAAPALSSPVPALPVQPSSDLVEMTSPIVGTFFRASSPGAAPFVESGTRVKPGQVLCIIEAMKLMNEIEAEIDAEVVEILVANGQPVEFGEVLFRLRPLG